MFSHIVVPVDLAHKEALSRSLKCAGDLAKLNGAKLTFVGVTSSAPSSVAHNPDEYAAKLSEFAAQQGAAAGVEAQGHVAVSHDPSVDLDDTLLNAVEELDADLVVMASHVPGLAEYIWSSHGGKLANHAKVSVMLVRG